MFVFMLCLFLWSWLSSIHGLEFHYHNSMEMEQYLKDINRTLPDITHLHSIGQSVEGRELWVLILGQHPREHRTGIPEFKYVGNMHGNEAVGRVLLLQLIDYLTSRYLSDPLVTSLLNSSRVHILPSMNPDGFESSARECMYTKGRYNKNGVDLNRNFPDAFESTTGRKREKEVRAVMDWLKTQSFVLSANLHGGAVVASYPYDNSNGGSELQRGLSISPDDDVFVHLAKTYSYSHREMHNGNSCYDSQDFSHGVTNGYHWYPLPGGMQDYNYVWAQCLELTLEISCCKYPPEAQLPGLWAANKPALLAYMQQVHLGVKGVVMDSYGKPVQNAVVEVAGRRNVCPFRTDRNGEYYRLLLPGNYTIKVTYPGHKTLTRTIPVPYGPDAFSALTHNFLLQTSDYSSTATQLPQSCTTPDLGIQESDSATLLPSVFTALTLFLLQTLLMLS
ncbi:carboxypeptidase M-like isoform X1 [Sinocyclocheilus anshuiensis]|uniref:Carboxypeptidase M-like n=2 Tax=Sinocyclocheilus anshuiensis TaxID=1608454 RepID=A0A671N7H8_9TELE|nr:PREDICTED: carboxypeptidase M-like isoform X1 [Sinocyclocheilus anshuiensis]